jgi:DNA-directed RNA polymerase specialized sigma24 family protein
MRRQREPENLPHFFLNSVDHLGREIDTEVLSVAEKLGPRAVRRGEKLLGDPALALTLLEEVAATVTQAVRMKTHLGQPPISNLEHYLYGSFKHRLFKEKRREPVLVSFADLDWAFRGQRPGLGPVERELLQDQLLKTCDRVTIQIIFRRFDDESWREIGAACGISATAARLRFRKAMLQLRHIIDRK